MTFSILSSFGFQFCHVWGYQTNIFIFLRFFHITSLSKLDSVPFRNDSMLFSSCLIHNPSDAHVYLNKLFTARLGFRQKSSNPLLQILSHYLNNGLPLIKTIKKYKIILFMNYQFSLFIHFVYHFRCFIFGTFTSLEIITNNLKTIPHAYSQNSLR